MSTVLITGASRGLGLEFVRQYAEDDWNVIATCREPTKAEKLEKLGVTHANISMETLDVDDTKSIAALAEKLKDTVIDVLINNAGIFSGAGPKAFSPENPDTSQNFGSIDPDAWERVLYSNTIAPILVTEALLPSLRKSGDPKVIMISSAMGSIEEGNSGFIAYRTSKAALNAAMHNISHDLKPMNVTAVSFHPGWVKTDMGGAGADITPDVSIKGMRKVIAGLTIKNTGQFFAYDGKTVPW